jgi:hypothetical protein
MYTVQSHLAKTRKTSSDITHRIDFPGLLLGKHSIFAIVVGWNVEKAIPIGKKSRR